MEVTIVGADWYDYMKDGVPKRGGNIYYMMPVEAGKGTGQKSGSVYCRDGSQLHNDCLSKDFSKPIRGRLLMQMQSNGKAIVTGLEYLG